MTIKGVTTKAAMTLLYGGVVVAALVVFGVFVYSLTRPPSAPLKYTKDEYTAERLVYAPGEMVVYTASLTIERPGALDLERGWRGRPIESRSRLCNGKNADVITDDPPPFSQGAVNTNVEGRIEVRVPELPPGDYWLISSVSKADGGEAITRVPVRIIRPCPSG